LKFATDRPPSPKKPFAGLLDQFVGLHQQRLRHGETERFHSLQVDDHLELVRPFDR
jgi:hypothetical protein